jgi:hypothetical protein
MAQMQRHATSALNWSGSRSGRFIPWGKGPDTDWIGDWVSPRDGMEVVGKIKLSAHARN